MGKALPKGARDDPLAARRSLHTAKSCIIDPRVQPQTRTVSVRIHVDNPALRLKPDMWVTAQIDAGLSRDGRGAVPAPGGAFACPMHLWETADQLEACSICEMDMVRVEDLPQYSPPTEPLPVLSVLRDAVMQTGERALVYVETSPGAYHGTAVTVGPLAHGDDDREYYPILAGLRGAERVVTRGNFAIDSQMQLAGKPSLFAVRGFGDHQQESDAAHNAEAAAPDNADTPDSEQTVCPVMGNEIEPEVYTDYHGVRLYFCCPPCIDKFRQNPEGYMAALPEAIQAKLPQRTPRRRPTMINGLVRTFLQTPLLAVILAGAVAVFGWQGA